MQKQGKSSGKEQKICLYLEWSMKVLCDFIVCFGAVLGRRWTAGLWSRARLITRAHFQVEGPSHIP